MALPLQNIITHHRVLLSIPLAVSLLLLALGLVIGYLMLEALYNLFLHPLRSYPGPKLWAVSQIPYARISVSGQGHRKMLELHKIYGPVIRIGPNAVSYNHPEAMTAIRGHRRGGMAEHGKDPDLFGSHRLSILGADRDNHRRYRQILAHGFSAQTMLEQQPIIKSYIDSFIARIREESAGGVQPIDMVKWYNYTTFDIIGDLSFGEPFGCLQGSTYHPWVAMIFSSVKGLAISAHLERILHNQTLKKLIMPTNLAASLAESRQLATAKVHKRLATQTDRPDFINAMIKRSGSKGKELTFEELTSHARLLITAGSETTATALSAATWYLGMNPRVLAKLTDEVRSAFATEEEIDLNSVQKLSYMLAVLEETLRLYPPSPHGQPRIIAEGGDEILGRYIPGGARAEVIMWALYHNPAYFTQPDDFIPERWLGDPIFANDERQAVQPFSVGPRNCIGKNLAYSEMRQMLARVVWNFDIQLAMDSTDWEKKSEVYLLWNKPPANVYLKPRKMAG